MTDEQIAHRSRVDQAIRALVELGYKQRDNGTLLPPEVSATDEVTLGTGADALRIRPADMTEAQLQECADQEILASFSSPIDRYLWRFPASHWTMHRHALLRGRRVLVQNGTNHILWDDTNDADEIYGVAAERVERLEPSERGYHVYALPDVLGEAFFTDISDYEYIVAHGRHIASYRDLIPAPTPAKAVEETTLDTPPWF